MSDRNEQTHSSAQKNDWENPQMVGRHKEPGHVPLWPYADQESALAGDPDATPYVQSLNGDWHFAWSPNPAEVASIHRIPLTEFLRKDAPLIHESPDSDAPLILMPVGNTCIAAPTAAMLYQFREVALLGKSTRVAHYEQPAFAWR